MSKPRPYKGDAKARAERKRLRRASRAEAIPRTPAPSAQLDHASNPKGRRARREGERWLGKQAEPDLDEFPE